MHYGRSLALALGTALISGLANFVNKFGVSFWSSSTAYTTAKNVVAALLLAGLVVALKKLPELKRITRGQWLRLAAIAVIGGSIPFVLFFKGLTLISAGEASFIHKTMFLWVALLSLFIFRERLGRMQLAALVVLAGGVFLLDKPTGWLVSPGSLLVFGATILWAVENIIAKITLRDVSPAVVGWARMFVGSVVLVGYLALRGELSSIVPTTAAQAGWALATGIILFGYVTTWYAALKLAPATFVSSVLVIATPITLILNATFVTHTLPTVAVLPTLVIAAGIGLFAFSLRHRARNLLRYATD